MPCSTLPPGLIDDPSYIILRLVEVAVWPGLASLDLAQMPRPVRTTLYRDGSAPDPGCVNVELVLKFVFFRMTQKFPLPEHAQKYESTYGTQPYFA